MVIMMLALFYLYLIGCVLAYLYIRSSFRRKNKRWLKEDIKFVSTISLGSWPMMSLWAMNEYLSKDYYSKKQ